MISLNRAQEGEWNCVPSRRFYFMQWRYSLIEFINNEAMNNDEVLLVATPDHSQWEASIDVTWAAVDQSEASIGCDSRPQLNQLTMIPWWWEGIVLNLHSSKSFNQSQTKVCSPIWEILLVLTQGAMNNTFLLRGKICW